MQQTNNNQKEIIVFTTPTCPYCHMVKDYLRQRKIVFKEIDVAQDYDWARKMVEKSGEMGVPQLWINEQVVVGFNRPQIDLLIDSRGR